MSVHIVVFTLFYFGGIVLLFLGGYCLYVEPKAKFNRIYFLAGLVSAVWLISSGLVVMAPNIDTATIWFSVSVVSSMFSYGLLLHWSVSVMLYHKEVNNRWIHPLIYMPAVVFTVLILLALQNNQSFVDIVRTNYGWKGFYRDIGSCTCYLLYSLLYPVLSVLALVRTYFIADDKNMKLYSRLVAIVLSIVYIIASLVRLSIYMMPKANILDYAPFMIIIVMAIIFRSATKYGLIHIKEIAKRVDLLNEEIRRKAYVNLGYIFYFGGAFNVVFQVNNSGNVIKIVITSSIIIVIGYIIHRTGIKGKLMMKDDLLFTIASSATIPIVTLLYYEYASITVWALGFVFIVISMIFTKRIVLAAISTSLIATQIFIWHLKPAVRVLVDQFDYTGRITLVIFVVWIALYVNRVYVYNLVKTMENEKEINYMAYHDFITGLPNRRSFNNELDTALKHAQILEKQVAVLFLDLDHFKSINDTLGHEGANSLLTEISKRLQASIKEGDFVARNGGDEFLLIIKETSHDDIIQRVEGLIHNLKEVISINDQKILLTCSVGISLYPNDGDDVDELITNADMAMYSAKDKGRNQFVLCNQEIKDELTEKKWLTHNLMSAIEENQFHLVYQPQIDIHANKITGVEALIRWVHPERGFISPALFIPVAESVGLIEKIGEWVFRTALQQQKVWCDKGIDSLCVAINVSAVQLKNPELFQSLKMTIEELGVPRDQIELEITESVAMDEVDNVFDILKKIKELGVLVSIDDFGTDYSSLGRLKDMSVDKLKIDKQFIDGIILSESDRAIVKIMIMLAENLGLEVIAEGVEVKDQVEFLKENNCKSVQGYYYYKPMLPEEIEELIKA